jgi:hypothetical protein
VKAHSERTNTTKYTATVSERDVTAALCEMLAKQYGLTLQDSSVRFRGYHSSEDTGTGINHSWKIEVTVDHSLDPIVAEGPAT